MNRCTGRLLSQGRVCHRPEHEYVAFARSSLNRLVYYLAPITFSGVGSKMCDRRSIKTKGNLPGLRPASFESPQLLPQQATCKSSWSVKPPLDRSDGWQRCNNGLGACYLLTREPYGCLAGGCRHGPAVGRGAVRARLRRNAGTNYGRRRLHGGAGATMQVHHTVGAARHASARQAYLQGVCQNPRVRQPRHAAQASPRAAPEHGHQAGL